MRSLDPQYVAHEALNRMRIGLTDGNEELNFIKTCGFFTKIFIVTILIFYYILHFSE